MSFGADTSVIVPALLTEHEAHDRCAAALRDTTAAVAHAIAEAYSVLTRLPYPARVPPQIAAQALARQLPDMTVGLDGRGYALVPSRLAAAGLSGGSVYDGLIALAAADHGVELLTRDARAARTYRSLGVDFSLLSD